MEAPFPYPLPAATPQPTQYPASNEPFGVVHPTHTTRAQHHRRRASPYVETQITYANAISGKSNRDQGDAQYAHNRLVAVFLVPPLYLILWNHSSPIPLQTFLYLTLILYAIDLANLREAYVALLWTSALIMSIVNGWMLLLGLPEEKEDASGVSILVLLVKLLCESLIFGCLVSKVIV